MARLDDLKAKYASVLDLIQKSNVRVDHMHVQDDKLVLQGAAPTEAIKNKVWDQIKACDPTYSDLLCEIKVDSSIPAPTKTYTVQAGDSLSKIAKEFYGNMDYMKIFNANKDKLSDPNLIQPGQVLNIPD